MEETGNAFKCLATHTVTRPREGDSVSIRISYTHASASPPDVPCKSYTEEFDVGFSEWGSKLMKFVDRSPDRVVNIDTGPITLGAVSNTGEHTLKVAVCVGSREIMAVDASYLNYEWTKSEVDLGNGESSDMNRCAKATFECKEDLNVDPQCKRGVLIKGKRSPCDNRHETPLARSGKAPYKRTPVAYHPTSIRAYVRALDLYNAIAKDRALKHITSRPALAPRWLLPPPGKFPQVP